MTQHRSVEVKVNALVDEGVADLVATLSGVSGLVTMESCQGGDGQDAYVYFHMADWRQIGAFLFDRLLPAMSPDLRSVVSLRVQAYDVRVARGSITLEPHAVGLLADCIRKLASPVGARALVAGNAHCDAIT